MLAVVEFGLRLAGYGYGTAFFDETKGADGNRYLINRETFSRRFFPEGLARWPSPFKIPAEKPPGARRIFILGESAAMGDPQPAYGASRYLEVLLQERFPKERFEIVNFGITAINSHVIRPIAQEAAGKQGDIWIIYMGNNEMVGPFGASTVFGMRGAPPWLARFNLTLRKLRLGQWLIATLNKRARHGGDVTSNKSWGGMRMFLQNQVAPTDRRRASVYRNFEANLRDILDAGCDSGATVILNTIAVNLTDCPPFATFVETNQPAINNKEFSKLYDTAVALAQATNHAEAIKYFERAAKLSPRRAELEYRWGQSLLHTGNLVGARRLLMQACDDDALPFRADSRINGVIRKLAGERAGGKLLLCDAEAALQEASPVRVAGRESFFEHVHFNFDGNYRLARLWAEQVQRSIGGGGTAPAWATQEECERQLGLTDFNRAYVLQSVLRRMEVPPLNSQFNNRERVRALEDAERLLQMQMNQPEAATQARQMLEAAIQRRPEDAFLREGMGNLLESLGDKPGAAAAYRRAYELRPQDFYSRLRLGEVLGECGQIEEAHAFLAGVVTLRPSLPDGWNSLGLVQIARGDFAAAIGSYDRAQRLRPQEPAFAYYKLFCEGRLLAETNQHAKALAKYREAINLVPGNWEAHYEAGGELDAAGKLEAAMKEFGEAARLNPTHSRAHFNYGVLLAKLGHWDEALFQFDVTSRLEPGYTNARDYIGKVKALKAKASATVQSRN